MAAVQLLFWTGVRIAGGPSAARASAPASAAAVVAIGLASLARGRCGCCPRRRGRSACCCWSAVFPERVRRVGGVVADAAGRLRDAAARSSRAGGRVIVLGVGGTVLAYGCSPSS
jgi:hypothetical protein